MDLGLGSQRAWAAAAAASGGLLALGWLASAPLPKSSYEERLRLVRAWFVKHLVVTHTFDQVLGGFELEHMGTDGTLRGTIAVEGVMLSAEGTLHEGGLMCLVDTLTSVAVMAAGSPTGVTVDMSCSAPVPVARGERLLVVARTLRLGNTLAFTSCELRHAGTDGVVATGAQTKHIGLPWSGRLLHRACARFPLLARWFFRRSMAKLAESKLPRVTATSMEEALALQPLRAAPPYMGGAAAPGASRWWAAVQLHLLNGYWAGHGASSAALFAAAVREHLKKEGVAKSRITELSASYMRPVPAFRNIGIVVQPASEGVGRADGAWIFVAELLSEQGALLVRARVTAVPA